jgi:hypothetical protein
MLVLLTGSALKGCLGTELAQNLLCGPSEPLVRQDNQVAFLSTLDQKTENQNKYCYSPPPPSTAPKLNQTAWGLAVPVKELEKQNSPEQHRLVFVMAGPAHSQARKQSGFMRKCLSFHTVIESSCGSRLSINGV